MHNNPGADPTTDAAGVVPVGADAAGAALRPRLLDEVRRVVRTMHYSLRTEEQYVQWIRDYVRFHGMRHPREMARAEVEAYLMHLAVDRTVASATHRQALSALLFLYRRVLGVDLPWLGQLLHPRVKRRLPVVLSPDEVARLLGAIAAEPELLLFAQLLYGTGMRIAEALHLRVKDIDFSHRTIIVREGKGGKDRALMLPDALSTGLRLQLARSRQYWLADRAAQVAGVWLPDALARPAALLCHAPAAARAGHPHRARLAGPRRCEHDHDLHPCAQGGWRRRAQPARRTHGLSAAAAH